MLDKKADLAGPGIGDYSDLEKILPQDYSSLLHPQLNRPEETYNIVEVFDSGSCDWQGGH